MALKRRIIKVDEEFDNYLRKQLEQLIQDCETLGIPRKRISKPKATKLLAKRLIENGDKINLRLF